MSGTGKLFAKLTGNMKNIGEFDEEIYLMRMGAFMKWVMKLMIIMKREGGKW